MLHKVFVSIFFSALTTTVHAGWINNLAPRVSGVSCPTRGPCPGSLADGITPYVSEDDSVPGFAVCWYQYPDGTAQSCTYDLVCKQYTVLKQPA